jgi:hypothetical protein
MIRDNIGKINSEIPKLKAHSESDIIASPFIT